MDKVISVNVQKMYIANIIKCSMQETRLDQIESVFFLSFLGLFFYLKASF